VVALPRALKTTLGTIPADVPYLAANLERIAAWRTRLEEMGGRGPAEEGARGPAGRRELLVGIAWQGNPHHQWDRFRSVPLLLFEPLSRIPGVRLVSLQRGPGIEQIEGFQRLTGGSLWVPTDGLQITPGHLADSAALMTLLDLVISVDSATAHLAGALARPLWIVLSQAADWRWLTVRGDSPWYPTARLIRQRVMGDWEEVFGRVAALLGEFVRERRTENGERGKRNAGL
jgi:hypothetical protein